MSKADITREVIRCKACSTHFVPIDDSEFCETCGPWEEAKKQEDWHENLVEGDQ